VNANFLVKSSGLTRQGNRTQGPPITRCSSYKALYIKQKQQNASLKFTKS